MRYYAQIGIGEEPEFIRTANIIITIMRALDNKKKITPDDIFPQLKRAEHNCWNTFSPRLKRQLLATKVFNEQGEKL